MTRHVRFAGGLTCLAACLLGPAGASAQATVESARRAVQGGEPARAVETLRGALEAGTDPQVEAELALALLEADQPADALEAARRAAGVAPTRPAVAAALTLTRAAVYDVEGALAAADAALASHPDAGVLLAAKGRVLWQMKRTRSAVELLQRAARDPSSAADAQYWLGRIYYFKGWQGEGAFPGWHDEPEYRDQALAAFRSAASAAPAWFEPQVWIGASLLAAGDAAGALAAFDEANRLAPSATDPRVGRWRALAALGRGNESRSEIATAAASADVRQLDAARQGYELIGQTADAEQIAQAIAGRLPASAQAAAIEAAGIRAARQARQYPSIVDRAPAFLQRFPASPDRLAVYDALLEAYAATPSTPAERILETVTARNKARPDPAPYMAGANALAARRQLLDDVIRLAEAGMAAAATFIEENTGSYKMEGKVQGSLGRSRAAATDLIGWAYFLKQDLAQAEARLQEAERLSRSADFNNRYHLGELARTKGELDAAREHYLSALTLSSGPPPVRDAARTALADVYARLGNDPAEFETYLKGELERRSRERRERLVQSMADRAIPPMKLTDSSGRDFALETLRGKVLLLNFFSSW